jgi:kinesin family protein 6/9
MLVK